MPKGKSRPRAASLDRSRRLVGRLAGKLAKRLRRSDPPELSVIVPAFNTELYIAACLESIMAQNVASLEVIVVNDGSTDSTAEIVSDLAAKHPQIRLINRPHAGSGAARNYGLRKARGVYLTFVDSDDTLTPKIHQTALASLQKTGSDMAIFGVVHSQSGRLTLSLWARYIHDHNRLATNIEQFPAMLRDFYNPNKIYRASFWRAAKARFRQVPLFDDQPVVTDLLCRATSIDILRHPGYHWRHRAEANSISDSMRHAVGIAARAEATALTRPIVTALGNQTVLQAWLYTIIENHLLTTYLAHLDDLDCDAVAALPNFVRAAGQRSEILLSPQVSPAAAVLALLTLGDRMDLVTRLVQAGWAGPARAWLRGQTGRSHLIETLGQSTVDSLVRADAGTSVKPDGGSSHGKADTTGLGGLVDCFEGRQPDPQRLTIRLTRVVWLEDGSLAIAGRIPFLTGFARDSANLTVAIISTNQASPALVSAQAKLRDLTPPETKDPDTWPRAAREIGQLAGFDVTLPNVSDALLAAVDAGGPLNRRKSWPVQFQINVAAANYPTGSAGPAEYQLDQTGWAYTGHTVIRPKPHPPTDQRRFSPSGRVRLAWSCKDRHWLRVSLIQVSD